MSRVTIETICKATGLSRGTVSRALNNRADINARTRQRVIEVCRRFNFKPSPAARALATGRHYALAVLTPDLAEPFATAVIQGVLGVAGSAGFAVTLNELTGPAAAAGVAPVDFGTLAVDGFVLVGPLANVPGDFGAKRAKSLVASHILPGIECDVRTPDQREAGRVAARLFEQMGVAQAGYICNSQCSRQSECGAGFAEARPPGAAFSLLEPVEAQQWLRSVSSRSGLLGIAATSDAFALQGMVAAVMNGRKPGVDLAVLGQGNESWTAHVSPGLSTIDCGGRECGTWLATTLLERINGTRTGLPQVAYHAPRPILRFSTPSLTS